MEPRVEVYYGRVDNTPGKKRYSYVVVRTRAQQIQYHPTVYQPRDCEYEVLYEVPETEISARGLAVMDHPGWAAPETKQSVLELAQEEGALSFAFPTSSSSIPAKRRLTEEQSTGSDHNNGGQEEEEEQEGDSAGLHFLNEQLEESERQDPKNMSLDLEREIGRGYHERGEWGEREDGEEGDRGEEGDVRFNEEGELLEEEEEVDAAVLDEGPVNQLLAYLSSKDYSYLPNAGEYESHEPIKYFDKVNEEMKGIQEELINLVTECLYLHDPTEIARVVLECDNHGCNMLIVFVLRLLFHRGADPGLAAGVEQVTMPLVAAEWGEAAFLLELLERGVHIDHRGPNGMTVMHFLVSNLPNVDPRKLAGILSVTHALLALEPNFTLRSHTQETVLQLLEQNIELGGLAFTHDSPPSEVWQLSALLQQAVSDFEVHPCLKCGRPAANNRCSRCQVARYCGAPCQRLHWKYHKRVCIEKVEAKTDRPS